MFQNPYKKGEKIAIIIFKYWVKFSLLIANDVYNLFLGQLLQNLQIDKVCSVKKASVNIHFTK